MRVLLVSLNYWPEPTGIAPYSSKLAEGLSSAGHEVHVVTGIPHYPEWRNITESTALRRSEWVHGVRVTRLRHYIPPGGTGLRRGLLEASFAASLLFYPWDRSDVTICVSPSLLGTAIALAKERSRRDGAPTAVWVQDLYSRGFAELRGRSHLFAPMVGWLESAVLKRADAVVVIHQRFATIVGQTLGVPAESIQEIRNWAHVDPGPIAERIRQVREAYGWGTRPVILHCGNMGVKQGLSSVVAAAKQAMAERSDVLFVLLGDGSERHTLAKEAEGCSNIVFLPPLPDLEFPAVLGAADILLLNEQSGVREMALPSKLTTYFAAGKPIVAAVDATGVSAEEVRLAGAGLIVEPANAPSLLNAIDRLLKNPALATSLATRGKLYAEQNLSQRAVLSKWRRLIERISKLEADPSGRAHDARTHSGTWRRMRPQLSRRRSA